MDVEVTHIFSSHFAEVLEFISLNSTQHIEASLPLAKRLVSLSTELTGSAVFLMWAALDTGIC